MACRAAKVSVSTVIARPALRVNPPPQRFGPVAPGAPRNAEWRYSHRVKARFRWTVRRDVGERELLDGLRRRDEQAFAQLIDLYGGSMLRVARGFVPSQAVAEEVVQEAWLGVLRGIDRFEERSSLKTWLFRIVVNTARTRGVRESRSVPFSALGHEPAVEPERFLGPDHPEHPGAWATPPHEWPAARLEEKETRAVIDRTIAELPPLQRQVITLRDIEGWTADETCNALELTETNQRVLLHRARARVRRALERHFDQT
jgi:RNA polymerase sigma-70 factor, ECF subfamily